MWPRLRHWWAGCYSFAPVWDGSGRTVLWRCIHCDTKYYRGLQGSHMMIKKEQA